MLINMCAASFHRHIPIVLLRARRRTCSKNCCNNCAIVSCVVYVSNSFVSAARVLGYGPASNTVYLALDRMFVDPGVRMREVDHCIYRVRVSLAIAGGGAQSTVPLLPGLPPIMDRLTLLSKSINRVFFSSFPTSSSVSCARIGRPMKIWSRGAHPPQPPSTD